MVILSVIRGTAKFYSTQKYYRRRVESDAKSGNKIEMGVLLHNPERAIVFGLACGIWVMHLQ